LFCFAALKILGVTTRQLTAKRPHRCAEESKDKKRSMENELRDPKYFLEYLVPRPIRLAVLAASGFGCFIALLLCVATLAAEGVQVAKEDGTLLNFGINAVGLTAFTGTIASTLPSNRICSHVNGLIQAPGLL
jgi:hypothetical protein